MYVHVHICVGIYVCMYVCIYVYNTLMCIQEACMDVMYVALSPEFCQTETHTQTHKTSQTCCIYRAFHVLT